MKKRKKEAKRAKRAAEQQITEDFDTTQGSKPDADAVEVDEKIEEVQRDLALLVASSFKVLSNSSSVTVSCKFPKMTRCFEIRLYRSFQRISVSIIFWRIFSWKLTVWCMGDDYYSNYT